MPHQISEEEMKPTLHLSEKDLKAIKTWDVDGKYTLEVEVEMFSKQKPIFSSKRGIEGGFKINSVKEK